MSERPVLFGERKKMPIAIGRPVNSTIRFLQKNTVRTVHFREILEIAGFWILSASFLNSAISTVRPVFFCEKCQIRWENAKRVPYVRYFSAGIGKSTVRTVLFAGFAKESTVHTVIFGTKKMAKISVVFAN